MNIVLAVVTEIVDNKKFIIKFSVSGIIDNMIAYPIEVMDEPTIGDPIVCYEIESILGMSYIYKKQRLLDYTKLKLGKSEIDIMDEGIQILTTDGSTVTINSSGDIIIKSNGSLDVSSDVRITLNAPQIKFPSGTVSGTGGPFCTKLICPFDGTPHVGNVINTL